MRGEWREAERHLEKAVDAGLASGAVGLEVPARVLASEAALRLGRPGQAVSQARKALEHPRALADERSEARAALAAALAASGEASAAAGEARRALDEAEAMGLLLVAARAAQVLVSLPAPGRPVDVEAIRDRGRRALEGYLAGAPEDRRSLVRKRSDLSDLFTALK
jgi:hypothetical protein